MGLTIASCVYTASLNVQNISKSKYNYSSELILMAIFVAESININRLQDILAM